MTSPKPPDVPPVHRTVLDNGMTLLVREDRAAPVVSAQVWVKTGSIHEDERLGYGLSHFLEHMFFKGSSNRPASRLVQEVQDRGGRMNAYTSFDQTVFYIDIPSDAWRSAVDILADAIRNPLFPEEEFDKERGVILRELDRGRDEPGRRLWHALWATAYSRHPYRHPIIGYLPLVEQVTRDDMVAYFRKRYVPDNLIFVLAGDIDANEAREALQQAFRDLPRRLNPEPYLPTEPPQAGARSIHDEMDVQLSRLGLAFHTVSASHPDVAALDVLATILGDGRGSRLYRSLRDGSELVHEIDAWSYTPLEPGLFGVTAVAEPDKIAQARDAVLAELLACRNSPPSAEELHRAVLRRIAGWTRSQQTMAGQARDIGEGERYAANPRFSADYLAALTALTPADIQAVAAKYLVLANANWATVGPRPAADTGADGASTHPAAAPPEPTMRTLPNGVRLILIEDHRLPLVEVRAALPGGVLYEDEHNNGITALTARLLLKGTTTRSADEITDAIESSGGRIEAQAGNNTLYVNLSVLGDQLATDADVFADVLLNPSFPEKAFEREREAQTADVRAENDEIFRVAQRVLRETVFGQHPYRFTPNGLERSLAGLDRHDVASFYRTLLQGGNLVVAVAGDFEPEAAVTLFTRLLADVPPGNELQLPGSLPVPMRAALTRERHLDREQAVVLVGYNGTDATSPLRPAMEIIDTALSGQGTSLFERVRERQGLAYYVGSFQFAGFHPGLFALYAGTRPDAAENVRDELLAEAARLRDEGLSEEELERARQRLIGGLSMRRQDLGAVALEAALDELYGLGYDHASRMADLYAAVTRDQVREAANSLLKEDAYAVTIVRPTPDETTPGEEGEEEQEETADEQPEP